MNLLPLRLEYSNSTGTYTWQVTDKREGRGREVAATSREGMGRISSFVVGLVFVSPSISDLIWTGKSESIQLVSVGLIRPVTSVNQPRLQGGEIRELSMIPFLLLFSKVSLSFSHHYHLFLIFNLAEYSLEEISPSNSVGIDYRYSSPEHTGRTGNPIDSRSGILIIVYENGETKLTICGMYLDPSHIFIALALCCT
jgi:hypothetical protein